MFNSGLRFLMKSNSKTKQINLFLKYSVLKPGRLKVLCCLKLYDVLEAEGCGDCVVHQISH